MRWLLLLLLLGPALAANPPLRLEEGWVRWVPGNISAAYLVLYNPTPKPIRLVGASSPVATRVEFHQTAMGRDDFSAMRPVPYLEVPPKGRLEILPGKYHLMLYGIREKTGGPLVRGSKVALTLRLADGTTLTFTLPVEMR